MERRGEEEQERGKKKRKKEGNKGEEKTEAGKKGKHISVDDSMLSMQPRGTLSLHACCQLHCTLSPGARLAHMLEHITRRRQ